MGSYGSPPDASRLLSSHSCRVTAADGLTRLNYATAGFRFTLAQHYRDRADMENVFDELKSQWGWGGYTTKDLKGRQLIARQIALMYNWWSMFVRLAIPWRHAEAITSRPSLLTAVGTQTRHQGQTTLRLTSAHAKTGQIQRALRNLRGFFPDCRATAEQLGWAALRRKMLSRIFAVFLRGRPLHPPPLLPHPT